MSPLLQDSFLGIYPDCKRVSSQRGNGDADSILLPFPINLFPLARKEAFTLAVCSYYRKQIEELEKVQERVTSRIKGLSGLELCREVAKIRPEFISNWRLTGDMIEM